MQTYQIKIVLNGIDPPIWRRLQVSSAMTLEVLHLVIQAAMGWHNTHLHKFVVDGQKYAPLDKDASPEVIEETGVTLESLICREGETMRYNYDVEDRWQHTVTLEMILPPSEDLPRCMDGKRACPPEDCAGIPAYAALLPTNRQSSLENDDAIEWVSDFDPESFNLAAVNEVLADFTVESESSSPRPEVTTPASREINMVAEDIAAVPPPRPDEDKIDAAVLALLSLTFHGDNDVVRAWKTFDWDALNRLHDKGYIHNPVGKVKSVAMTEKGVERAKQLFAELFSR